MMDTEIIDLGDGHTLEFTCWNPDRDLNPQYEGIPDIPKFGAIITHQTPEGLECMSHVNFDTPEVRRVELREQVRWQVESWEPLTLSPSILCRKCGDHGFIRAGKWVPS